MLERNPLRFPCGVELWIVNASDGRQRRILRMGVGELNGLDWSR